MTYANDAKSTIRHEISVGRANTPDFSWPSVLLALGCLAAFAASVTLAMTGMISYLVAGVINALVIYAIYTVLHEAVHMNISAKRKDLQWVDRLLGSLAGVLLWQFYDHHRADHLVHHRITNHDDDPDISARAGFLYYVFVRLPVVLMSYFNPVLLYQRCKELQMPRKGIQRSMAGFAVNTVLAVTVIALGYGYELLTLWLVPWYIGNSVMLIMFTWSPHHDHHETGRYRNTRVIEVPGGNVLLLGQGYHLIHHMMPGIPWYRYKTTFDDLRPTLQDHNVRIEGMLPSAGPSATNPAE